MTFWNSFIYRWNLSALKERVIGVVEPISIVRKDGTKQHNILAQVDLTQDESCIDKTLAKELGIYSSDLILERVEKTLQGRKRLVEVISVSFTLKNKDQSSQWCVLDRSDENVLVTLGKSDCTGFLITVGNLEK